ncbi:MAG TPA: bacteriorhodopsin [Gemmatirosa sp.]|nr:bacteriorhodopsin [Gemmatirosa sp.]
MPAYEYLIAFIVPVWSGAAYLAMVFGQGKTEAYGQTAHWARYVDWVVSTPLLLLALAFTALHQTREKGRHATLVAGLLAADVFMILTGLVADLSPYPLRYVWYLLGCAALVVILAVVWGPLRRIAEASSPELGRVYRRVAGLLAVLWIGYPLFWILGPSGLRVIGQSTETLLFVVWPILSKVGWSLVDLTSLRALNARTAGDAPSSRAAEAAPLAPARG